MFYMLYLLFQLIYCIKIDEGEMCQFKLRLQNSHFVDLFGALKEIRRCLNEISGREELLLI